MISIQKVKFYWNLNIENLKKKERKVIVQGNKTEIFIGLIAIHCPFFKTTNNL